MKYIKLSKGQYAIVDDDDHEELSKYKWYSNRGYPLRRLKRIKDKNNKVIGRPNVWMHRQIMKASKGMMVDHINHNTLDNRKSNLRLCNSSSNMHNSIRRTGISGFRGVTLDGKKWMARIKINNYHKYLGRFDRKEDAARFYDYAAKRYHGEFAVLNFNDENKKS